MLGMEGKKHTDSEPQQQWGNVLHVSPPPHYLGLITVGVAQHRTLFGFLNVRTAQLDFDLVSHLSDNG